MNIADAFNRHKAAVAQIQIFQRAARLGVKQELDRLATFEQSFDGAASHPAAPFSMHKMWFYEATSGARHFFGHTVQDFAEIKMSLVLQQNKQYQWLLVECYEAFREYVVEAFAIACFHDHSFCRGADFGCAALSELSEKPFDWFLQKLQKKSQDESLSILNRFGVMLPAVLCAETANCIGVNLRLAVCLIANMRHVIVHKRGKVSDKKQFIDKTFETSGLSPLGEAAKAHREFMEVFFGLDLMSNTIVLLEIPTDCTLHIVVHTDVFEKLSSYLLAYAHLLKVSLEEYLTSKT